LRLSVRLLLRASPNAVSKFEAGEKLPVIAIIVIILSKLVPQRGARVGGENFGGKVGRVAVR
jgi:hypothetical protein